MWPTIINSPHVRDKDCTNYQLHYVVRYKHANVAFNIRSWNLQRFVRIQYICLCTNAHVSFTQILNCSLLNVQIYDQGYSRIPVYEETRDNVIGLLLVKMLIRTDICEKTIRSLVSSLLIPKFCLKVTPLYTALNQFFIVKSEFRIYHVISYLKMGMPYTGNFGK